ncbi:MAG TPA: outer membrane lipoprotein carrier protein LolA [bacterium]|mgnify:CR=1 FL=1|nr:outer membrane lipoprotein carrier protein LolA [bacterium]HPS30558.1 outer membrane lipoprotein carrier protein LolA [bacterium]
MKKILLLILLMFSACYAETVDADNVKQDAETAFKELADSTSAVKWQKVISENTRNIHSIQSSFKQTKNLSFLSDKVISSGKFVFRKNDSDNSLKWEYTTPFIYTIVIDGTRITMKDGKKISSFDMSSSKVFEEINEIMIKSLNGTILSDNKNFTFSINESGNELVIEMIPVKGTPLTDYFKNIKMIMDKTDFTVTKLTMIENSGDFTELVFTAKKINGKIDEKEFAVH